MSDSGNIICVVDNAVKRSSALWGEHGVSFWIERASQTLLFDTGQSGDVLLHNLDVLGLSLAQVDVLAFSHAHYDHTGGLKAALPGLRPGVILACHPSFFEKRFSLRDETIRSIGVEQEKHDLEVHFRLAPSLHPAELIPGLWTTGNITERPHYEGRSERHRVQRDGELISDPYADDLSLVIETGEGLTLVCGCCHAGLLNTLHQVVSYFQKPVRTIIGGTHLSGISDEDMELTGVQLKEVFDSPDLYLNHCTGEKALMRLDQAFSGKVNPFPAGSSLTV